MSNDSLDIAELEAALNDDSDGQRFANFLKKKQGKVRQHRRVFDDVDTPRLSLNVRVQKVDKPKTDQNVTSNKEIPEEPQHGLGAPTIAIADEMVNNSPPPSQLTALPAMRLSAHQSGGGISDRLRRYSLKRASGLIPGRRALINEFENTVDSVNFVPTLYSTPNSLNRSGQAEEVIANEKILLTSFEMSDRNSSNARDTQEELLSLQRKDAELLEILEETLKRAQQEKENEIRGIIERTPSPGRIPSTPGSARRHTYTIEKGERPGQVVLTPTPATSPVRIQSVLLSQSSSTNQASRIRVRSNQDLLRCANVLKIPSSLTRPETPKSLKEKNQHCYENVIPDTPKMQTIPVSQEHHTFIPETQEILSPTTQLNRSIQNSSAFPTVIIPLHQTFNGIVPAECSNLFNNKEMLITASPKYRVSVNKETTNEENQSSHNVTKNKPTPKAPPTRAIECNERSVDDLRLSDILTDDEDVPSQPDNSNAPLNLAASSESTQRKRRLRRRSTSRRRIQIDKSQLPTTETESENVQTRTNNNKGRPLNLRRKINNREERLSRRTQPLNKAPSNPINGEEFALELERMSYYEILDLRKRNSMGGVFCINGSRSSAKEEAIQQQRKLDEEIQIELRRRKSSSGVEDEVVQNKKSMLLPSTSITNVEKDSSCGVLELPPAPDGFKDGCIERIPAEAIIPNAATESDDACSLIDERSSDRISFLPPPQKRNSAENTLPLNSNKRKRTKNVTKELKNYLDASKKIKKKSKRLNRSKRRLYSKGGSDLDETHTNSNSSFEKENQECTIKPIAQSVPSPPHSLPEQRVSDLHIASPPPPLSLSSPSSPLPPPPALFANNDAVQENTLLCSVEEPLSQTKSSRIKKNMPTDNNKTTTLVNDDGLFKIPVVPPPKNSKGRPRKLKLNQVVGSESTAADTKDDHNDSVRRSRRGQVPLNSFNPRSYFQEMYEAEMEKCRQRAEKRTKLLKEQQKAQKKSLANATPIASSTAFSYTASNSEKKDYTNKNKNKKKDKETAATAKKQANTEQSQHSQNQGEASSVEEGPAARVYSMLGDTNCTAALTMSSVSSRRPISPIYEAIAEEIALDIETNNVQDEEEQQIPSTSKQLPAKLKSKKPTTKTKANSKTKTSKKKHGFEQSIGAANQLMPAPVDELNSIFNQLKSASVCEEITETQTSSVPELTGPNSCSANTASEPPTNSQRKLRVRLRRCNFEKFQGSKSTQLQDEGNSNQTEQSEPSGESVQTQPTNQTKRKANDKSKQPKNNNKDKVKDTTTTTATATDKDNDNDNDKDKDNNNDNDKDKDKEKDKDNTNMPETSSVNKNDELLTWLKCAVDNPSLTVKNQQLFNGMHISSAGNLIFTELEGLDYAFYDTEHKASLGYLRFKPRQIKPSKRAKRYHLHFIVLAGEFKFGTVDEHGTFKNGDMIAINKGVRYSIENVTDDIALLMVIKK